jgi:hypothetical protein
MKGQSVLSLLISYKYSMLLSFPLPGTVVATKQLSAMALWWVKPLPEETEPFRR